ncbi:hypothetical protein FOA52_012661 [Chlamydomonas sp. UWO 241]|nr:hypothetical protein FOA52_012661 [Chlamydomonas sp. UWO 241]
MASPSTLLAMLAMMLVLTAHSASAFGTEWQFWYESPGNSKSPGAKCNGMHKWDSGAKKGDVTCTISGTTWSGVPIPGQSTNSCGPTKNPVAAAGSTTMTFYHDNQWWGGGCFSAQVNKPTGGKCEGSFTVSCA